VTGAVNAAKLRDGEIDARMENAQIPRNRARVILLVDFMARLLTMAEKCLD